MQIYLYYSVKLYLYTSESLQHSPQGTSCGKGKATAIKSKMYIQQIYMYTIFINDIIKKDVFK